jgi:methylmalonyl-CoA/ethylmalonyl-CoA epimerase
MGFVELDHVGIVARTWDEAAEVLLRQLGLDLDAARTPMPDGSYFAPERTNNYFVKVGLGNTRVEVLIPADTTSGTARFLARNGPGLHHLGYACEDVATEAQRLLDRGMKMIDLGPTSDPSRMRAAFFHPKSVGGILTELVPVYRPRQ